jgi:O-antigen/teichoic acid export membrane protein
VTAAANRVLSTTTVQIGAKSLHLIVNIISTLAIVHYLAPGDFGSYTLAVTTTMLFGLIADGGLIRLAIREVMQDKATIDSVAGSLAVVRAGLALIAGLCVQLVLFLLSASSAVHIGSAVLSLGYVIEGLLVVMVLPFHTQHRQDLDVGVRLFGECVETLTLLVMIAAGVGLVPLFAAPVVGGVAAVALGTYFSRCRFLLRPQVNVTMVRTFWAEAVPLIPAIVIGVAAIRLDSFVIAWLRPDRELGLYGAAHQPIEYAFLATAVVISVSFPPLAASWGIDREQFGAIYRNTITVLTTLTLLAPILVLFVGEPMINLAYGSEYIDSYGVMLLLSWAVPLMTISGWNAVVLLGGGRQRTTLAYDSCALVLAAIALPLLVRSRGIRGAAVGTLLVLVTVCVVSTVLVTRQLAVRVHATQLIPALGCTVALLVGWAAQSVGLAWPVVGVVVAAMHLGCTTLLGGLPLRAWARSVTTANVTDPVIDPVIDLVELNAPRELSSTGVLR